MSDEKPFRIFNTGSIELGTYEDNCLEENPANHSGAMIIFDAWKQSSYFQFRIYHPDKDLPIKLIGTGFSQLDRTSTYIPTTDWETGDELDYGEYETKIEFYLTEPEGQVLVDVPKTFPWDDDCLVRWDSTHIYDIHGCKAKLKVIDTRKYEISELLSDRQKKSYALRDRLSKLKRILKHNRLHEADYQLNLAMMSGGFQLVDGDY